MWNVLFVVLAIAVTVQAAPCKFTGINQSGGEFGDDVPGVLDKDYTYPTTSADYFVNKGMNIFRLPFKWERVIQTKGANWTSADINRYIASVEYMTKNAYVIIDPHNYGRGYGGIIGESSTTTQDFVNFWVKLATVFKSNPRVIFGLMNEPHDQNPWIWREAAQKAVDGIRSTGATQLILVPGTAYTGAGSWIGSNSEVMWDIIDPLNNHAIEVHQYQDEHSSGTVPTCKSATFGAQRLEGFTEWARVYRKMAILGEFGGSTIPECMVGLDNMITYMEQNLDVWLGWTYWGGGPWWGDYFFTLQPNSTGLDREQWPYIAKHLNKQLPAVPKVEGNVEPGPINVPIYRDQLMNGYGSWSWPKYQTSSTVKRSGDNSIIFNATSGTALCLVCFDCVNATRYTYIQFWIYLESGSAEGMSFRMVNVVDNALKDANPVYKLTAFMSSSFVPKTWQQVTIPLANWTTADEVFDGFKITGSGSGQNSLIDDIYAVKYVYGATPSTSSTTQSATTSKSATSTTAKAATSTSTTKASTSTTSTTKAATSTTKAATSTTSTTKAPSTSTTTASGSSTSAKSASTSSQGASTSGTPGASTTNAPTAAPTAAPADGEQESSAALVSPVLLLAFIGMCAMLF
jgi:endoglucanase